MQRQLQPKLRRRLFRRPSVGDLLALCEENYASLHRLIPQLQQIHGQHRSRRPDHQDLHLTILEQTPYTTLLRLTYRFAQGEHRAAEPDALLRVYHDARQVEVEDLRQQVLPTARLYGAPALINRWRVNVFVAKWLSFCLSQGHLFLAESACTPDLVCDLG